MGTVTNHAGALVARGENSPRRNTGGTRLGISPASPKCSKLLYEAEIEVSAVWRGGTYQPLMISSARRPFFSCSIPPGISS